MRRSDGKGEGDGMIRSEGGDWEDVLDGDESDGEVKKKRDGEDGRKS